MESMTVDQTVHAIGNYFESVCTSSQADQANRSGPVDEKRIRAVSSNIQHKEPDSKPNAGCSHKRQAGTRGKEKQV